MSKNWTLFKKLHRWPGLIISFILLYYAMTGIIMNHRQLFSGIDLNRKIMPSNYDYKNWNNAALKGNLIINNDSILVFGNIGIWLTDSGFKDYASFNSGFPEGSDNRKVFDVHRTQEGNMYAATLCGLYAFNKTERRWEKFYLADKEERFTALESIGDTIFAINRSHLFKGISKGVTTGFTTIDLPPPAGFSRKVTLFQTIWQIHSGEILGIPGKVYVDLLGIITMFLSVTGIIHFFFPGWIKRRYRKVRESIKIIRINKWSLRLHNKVGAWTFFLLILLYFSGMFLRPPLLIAIGQTEVLPIRYSHLDQPNPWYDKLRDILYDPDRRCFILAASDGIYKMNPHDFNTVEFINQPPVSVMGITVLENYESGNYLIGSFSGLFLWNPERSEIYDFIKGSNYSGTSGGRPVGDFKITGIIRDTRNHQYYVDYSSGLRPIGQNSTLIEMPENIIRESKISLWSVCLEIHTGRIWENLISDFYILIVPMAGLTGITVVLSGYILWRRKYRKSGYNNIL